MVGKKNEKKKTKGKINLIVRKIKTETKKKKLTNGRGAAQVDNKVCVGEQTNTNLQLTLMSAQVCHAVMQNRQVR